MRADAEMIFVPASDVPEATLGDTVAVSDASGQQRVGTIIDTTDRDGQPFFRLEFDAT